MITDASNLTKLTINVTETTAMFMCESVADVDHWEMWVREGEGTTNAFEQINFEKNVKEWDDKYLRQEIFDLKRGTTYFGYVIAVNSQGDKSILSNIVEFDTFPDSRYKGINPIAHVKEDGYIWENGHRVKK